MNTMQGLVDYITDNYNDEEWDIFEDILKIVRRYNDTEGLDRKSMIKLIDLLPTVKECSIKAIIIEIIANYSIGQYWECEELLFDNIEKLFYEYMGTFSFNVIDDETGESRECFRNLDIYETKLCLQWLKELGIQEDEIISKVVENLQEKDAMQVLTCLEIDKNIKEKYPEIYKKADKIGRLMVRSGIISTFILITHPLCSKYDYIHCVSSQYNSAKVAAEDWGWNTPGGANALVRNKEFSEREARILEKLGKILFDDIYLDLDSKEIKDLYFEFFGDNDPYDVMFTLPS